MSQIKTEGIFTGLENLLPLIYPKLDTFFDYVSSNTLFILMEPGQLAGALESFQIHARRSYEAARAQHRLCSDSSQLYLTWDQVKGHLSSFPQLAFKGLSLAPAADSADDSRALCLMRTQDITDVSQGVKSAQKTEKPFQPLVDWLHAQATAGLTVFIICRRPSNLERFIHILDPYGVHPAVIQRMADAELGRGRNL